MTCCGYVVILIGMTACTGICCITLIFTSRSCYFCLMSMTYCRDGLCCGLATFICTRLGKNALALASGSCRYCTLIPAMTCCSYVVILIRVTTYASMKCVTLLLTSRSNYVSFICMINNVDRLCFKVIAICAIASLLTNFSTSRSLCNHPITHRVLDFIKSSLFIVVAIYAITSFATLRISGRSSIYFPFAICMFNRLYPVIYIGMTAVTGPSCIAPFAAGRLRNCGSMFVSQGRDGLLLHYGFTTYLTM